MKDSSRVYLATIGFITLLIILIGLLVVMCEHMRISGELCQAECEKINLTVEMIHYEGEPWWHGEVKSCDCKIPDYIRVKVKT